MNRIKEFFYRLLRPAFWMQNYPTNYEWDEILNEAMDNHEPTEIRWCVCSFGNLRVWIENYPYAFGCPDRSSLQNVLPRAKTRKRLFEKLKKLRQDAETSEMERLRSLARPAVKTGVEVEA